MDEWPLDLRFTLLLLGYVVAGAAVALAFGYVTHWIGLSPIVGYLLAGVLFDAEGEAMKQSRQPRFEVTMSPGLKFSARDSRTSPTAPPSSGRPRPNGAT